MGYKDQDDSVREEASATTEAVSFKCLRFVRSA